jgi:exosome complex component RRP46
MTAVILAFSSDSKTQPIVPNPTLTELQSADSVHVLGFTSHGELLVAESEGSFTIDEWDKVFSAAKRLCCDDIETDSETDIMQDEISEQKGSEATFIRSVVGEKVEAELHWKE